MRCADHDLPRDLGRLRHPGDEHDHVCGAQETGIKHRIIWGIILTLVIGTLILAAGENNPMDALRNAMIIGALPFTMVMGLMCLALGKALYNDSRREKHGVSAAEPAE